MIYPVKIKTNSYSYNASYQLTDSIYPTSANMIGAGVGALAGGTLGYLKDRKNFKSNEDSPAIKKYKNTLLGGLAGAGIGYGAGTIYKGIKGNNSAQKLSKDIYNSRTSGDLVKLPETKHGNDLGFIANMDRNQMLDKEVRDDFAREISNSGILHQNKSVLKGLGVAGLVGGITLAGDALLNRPKKSETKKQSNTGLILGSTLGALSGGLGGHILDKKIDSKGNFFNRNKATIGGTVLGAFGGGIVGNRMDKHFDQSVSSAKSTFRDQVNFTQDDLARGIMNGSLDNPSINNSFDKLNGGLRKDLLNSLKKSRKEYKLNLQNLALGTAATGLGAGITASAIKDSMNKRTKSQSDIVRYGTIVFADGTSCKGWAVTKMHGMMDSVAKGLGQAANKWSKLPKSAKGAIIGAAGGAALGGAKKGVKGALMGAAGGAALGGAAGYAANTQGAKNFMNKVKDHKFNAFVADKMKATK